MAISGATVCCGMDAGAGQKEAGGGTAGGALAAVAGGAQHRQHADQSREGGRPSLDRATPLGLPFGGKSCRQGCGGCQVSLPSAAPSWLQGCFQTCSVFTFHCSDGSPMRVTRCTDCPRLLRSECRWCAAAVRSDLCATSTNLCQPAQHPSRFRALCAALQLRPGGPSAALGSRGSSRCICMQLIPMPQSLWRHEVCQANLRCCVRIAGSLKWAGRATPLRWRTRRSCGRSWSGSGRWGWTGRRAPRTYSRTPLPQRGGAAAGGAGAGDLMRVSTLMAGCSPAA